MIDEVEDPRNFNGGPIFYVSDLVEPTLELQDLEHLALSRRLRSKEEILLSDGKGTVRSGLVTIDSRHKSRLKGEISELGPVFKLDPPEPKVRVVSYMPRGERLSFMVEKVAEVGVDELFLVSSPLDRRSGHPIGSATLARLERVARQASMQSKRVFPLSIGGVLSPHEVIDRFGDDAALCDQRGGLPSLKRKTWIIGPESGVVDALFDEVPRIRVGSEVLRVETASVVSAALLVALRDNLLVSSDISLQKRD